MPDDEPNAARSYNLSAEIKLPGMDVARDSINQTTTAVHGLQTALQSFGQNSFLAESVNRVLRAIATQADTTKTSLQGVSGALQGVGTASGARGVSPVAATPTASPATGGGGFRGGDWLTGSLGQVQDSINRITKTDIAGGLSISSFLGDVSVKDLALLPLKYLQGRIQTNRQTALAGGAALGMVGQQTGADLGSMLSTLARRPGGIYGNPQELLSLFGAAPAFGAAYNFGGQQGGQGPRAAGFFKGVQQAQMLNPGASVTDLAATIGGQAANVGSQQMSAFLTGGAFSMIGAGGRQKSLSEWAESILKWIQNMRGGSDRGKPFNYGQLMAQYYPGSNIDAWMSVNGISPEMKQYWWTYVLAKTNANAAEPDKKFEISAPEGNVAYQRLKASTELTKTEFGLAGQMTGAYVNREQANQWFNKLMGSMQQQLIPALAKSGIGTSLIQYMPDTIEELLMTMLDRGSDAVSKAVEGSVAGDVGDVGDGMYGALGGSGTAGLHPDMKTKLNRMRQANPRLRVTSGLRDNAMQKRLKAQGYSNVSGKPSAHTRGMAADLGPPSEYGWIVANAGKFGLTSGVKQGEPWHVGMGDVGDAFDTLSDWLKKLKPDNFAETITSMLGKFTNRISTWLGGSNDNTPIQADFGLFSRLSSASQKGLQSGIAPASTTGSSGGASSGGGGGGGGGGVSFGADSGTGTTGGRPTNYSSVRTPQDQVKAFSGSEMERGAAVAKALYAAGFRGTDLRNMTAISYRESTWTPNVWNLSGPDLSGGLLQINKKPWVDKGQTPPFSDEDVMDPYANAKIAYDMFTKAIPGPGGYSPWTIGGDWRKNVNLSKGDQAVAAAHLGDVDVMSYQTMLPTRSVNRAGVIFNNQFTINGGTGGSGGGIDVRRTAAMLADHLENEFNKRMARAN